MLCHVAVRRNVQVDAQDCPFVLRIMSKHTLGRAGGSSSDERGFPDAPALLDQLQTLQVPADVLSRASACMQADAQTERFVTIASSVQIAFPLLEEQGFDLFT